MPQLHKKENLSIHLNVIELLKDTQKYIRDNFTFVLCIFAVNMVYMLCLKTLDGGISNPLSIPWIISYYIFWCFFYRYYYHLRPYFDEKTILGSLAPSSKALVVLLLLMLLVLILPMLPLFLGFNKDYLDIYENYLSPESPLARGMISVSLGQILLAYGIFALISPALICKPYLAWISSLRGKNASFKKVRDRIKGNYWSFVAISVLLLFPKAIAAHLDEEWNCQSWLYYTISTTIFVYTNIIFAKIYDLFYLKN